MPRHLVWICLSCMATRRLRRSVHDYKCFGPWRPSQHYCTCTEQCLASTAELSVHGATIDLLQGTQLELEFERAETGTGTIDLIPLGGLMSHSSRFAPWLGKIIILLPHTVHSVILQNRNHPSRRSPHAYVTSTLADCANHDHHVRSSSRQRLGIANDLDDVHAINFIQES